MKKTIIEVDEALFKLEKGLFLLQELEEEYGWSEKPDPRLAVDYYSGVNSNEQAQRSAEWFWDYDRIMLKMNMVVDYIYSVKEKLEQKND